VISWTVRPGTTPGTARTSLIDEIVREGARRMLAEALQAEVDAYLAQFSKDSSQPWPATLVVGWRDATGNLGSTTVTTGALVS